MPKYRIKKTSLYLHGLKVRVSDIGEFVEYRGHDRNLISLRNDEWLFPVITFSLDDVERLKSELDME